MGDGIIGTVAVGTVVDSRLVDEARDAADLDRDAAHCKIGYKVRDYSEIPEETKLYADFLINMHTLGDAAKLRAFDLKRTEYHAKMCVAYKVPYEVTRVAVATIPISYLERRDADVALAQAIDQNMRTAKWEYETTVTRRKKDL